MQNKENRLPYWDNAKGVLIALVVLGHCIQLFDKDYLSNPLFKVIYMFHMPFFFFISGYFAWASITRHGYKFILRSSIRILPPIVALGTAEAVLKIYQGETSLLPLLGCYICLWFLWVLFECHIFGFLFAKLKNPAYQGIIVILPVLISLLIPKGLPYADYLSSCWPFYLLGMILGRKKTVITHLHFKHLIYSLPMAIICFYFFRDDWYMYTAPLKCSVPSLCIWGFRILAAITSGIAVLTLLQYLPPYSHLQHIGRASLGIYVIQAIIIEMAHMLSITTIIECNFLPYIVFPPLLLTAFFIYRYTCKIPLLGTIMYGEPLRKSTNSYKA